MGTRIFGVAALAIIIVGSVLLGPLDIDASGIRAGAALVKTGAILVVAIHAGCIATLITLWADLIHRKVRSRLLYIVSQCYIRTRLPALTTP